MDHNVLHAWIWLHKHLGFFTNSRQMFISEQSQTSEVIWEVVYFVVLQKHSCALLLHHVEFFVNRSNPSAYLTFQHIQYLLNVPPQKHQMPRPNRGNKPGHKRKKKILLKEKKRTDQIIWQFSKNINTTNARTSCWLQKKRVQKHELRTFMMAVSLHSTSHSTSILHPESSSMSSKGVKIKSLSN